MPPCLGLFQLDHIVMHAWCSNVAAMNIKRRWPREPKYSRHTRHDMQHEDEDEKNSRQ